MAKTPKRPRDANQLAKSVVENLGTGLLCSGGQKATAVSDFCALAKADIERLKSLTAEEVAALQRPRKEAIASLRRTMKRECK